MPDEQKITNNQEGPDLEVLSKEVDKFLKERENHIRE